MTGAAVGSAIGAQGGSAIGAAGGSAIGAPGGSAAASCRVGYLVGRDDGRAELALGQAGGGEPAGRDVVVHRAAGEVGQQLRAAAALGGAQPVVALQLQRQQRDQRARHLVRRGRRRRAVEQEHRPQAAGAERVHLAAPLAVDVHARPEQALRAHLRGQLGQLVDQPRGPACERPSEEVDHHRVAPGGPPVRGEDAAEPAGRHRRGRQRPLRGQRPLQVPALPPRPQREHRLRDGDERHPVGHGEQRHADGLARRRQRFRHHLVAQARPEAQPERGHPRRVEVRDVVVVAVQQQPDREEQLAALQPRPRLGELGDRGRRDLPIQPAAARGHLQAQRRIGDQLGHRRHVAIVASLDLHE